MAGGTQQQPIINLEVVMELVWKDPPKLTKEFRGSKYREIRIALRANEGKWALVAVEPSTPEVTKWRQAFRKRDGFKVHQYSIDSDTIEVYIKYGNAPSEEES